MLNSWILAHRTFEGWALPSIRNFWMGSRNFRNNNPINLRWSYLQSGTAGGFSYFKDYATGYQAAAHQLTIVANGTSPAYNVEAKKLGLADCSQLSLLQFCTIFAPSADKNNPLSYAQFIAQFLGVSVATQVHNLI